MGTGNTWPGQIVLYINPKIWQHLKKYLPENVILITGTNGKTTTSKLLAHILNSNGYKVLHNSTGANLLNGILTCILNGTSSDGSLNYDYLILEVDEFTLPELLKYVKPSCLALLNISRDQLDRHWETDIVYEKWLNSIKHIDSNDLTVIFLDETQLYLQKMANALNKTESKKIVFFNETLRIHTLMGAFNTKNVNCALSIALYLGISEQASLKSLATFKYAFGRGEMVSYRNKAYTILLSKNPASLNYNLEMLLSTRHDFDTFLFILNDLVPDGHDVSWIYDVLPEALFSVCQGKRIYVSGIRALDMAVRLNYCGLKIENDFVSDSISQAVQKISNDADAKNILVMPNYSAMLEIRKIVTGRSIL